MKYDYESMTRLELDTLYHDIFGDWFMVGTSTETFVENPREEMIRCIESGAPQDMSAWDRAYASLPEGAVM